jgi:hypothetical protein
MIFPPFWVGIDFDNIELIVMPYCMALKGKQ